MIWWPVVQQRLVALLPTLDGWADVVVYDGPPVSETGAQTYVTVGWTSTGESGGWEAPDETTDTMRAELGTVACELIVWGGDEALPTYRATAFALVDALDVAIRTDETLGVLPVSSTTSLSAEVVSAQDASGATQRLVISVNYFTRS